MNSLVDLAYSVSLNADMGAFSGLVNSTNKIKENMLGVIKSSENSENAFNQVKNAVNGTNTELEGTDKVAKEAHETFNNIAQSTKDVNENTEKMTDTYKGVNSNLKDTNKSFTDIKGNAKNVTSEVKNTKENTSNFNKKANEGVNIFNNVASSVKNVNEDVKGTNTSIENTNDSLKKADSIVIAATTKVKKMKGYYIETKEEIKNVNGALVKVTTNTKKTSDEIKKSKNETKKLGKEAHKASDGFKKLAKALAGAFVTKKIIDFGKDSLNTFMDFEQGMANVHATMGNISDKDFQKLSMAARKAGKETQFSAKDATEALNFEALAGWDVNKSISALPHMLNLASAGGLSMADASQLATQSMGTLGLQTKDLQSHVDMMAKTSQSSGTNIAELGQGILAAGGTARKAGMDLVAINTELGILADNGKRGADGGVALRNVLLNMTGNDKVHTFLKDMGVQTADATGKIRPLNNILMDLKGKMNGMTQAQKMATLSVIGGKENIQALNTLIDGSGKKYDELSKKIKNSTGAADEMAKKQNDTVRGALKNLRSAIEEVQISLIGGKNGKGGSATLKNTIKWITAHIPTAQKALGKFARGVGKAFKFIAKHKNVVVPAIKGIIGAFALFKTISFVKKSITGVTSSLKLLTSPVGLAVIAVAGLIAGFLYAYKHSEKFRTNVQKLWGTLKTVAGFIMDYVVPVITGAFSSLFDSAKAIFANIGQVIGGIIQVCSGVIDFIAGVFTGNWSRAWTGIKEIFGGIWEGIKGVFCGVINFITSGINVLIRGINKLHFKVPDWVPVPGIRGKELGFNIPEIPRLAKGTQSWQGGIARINDEFGGEIVEMPGGSKVYPHDQSIHKAKEDGRKEATKTPTNVNLTININGAKDTKEVAREVKKQLESLFGTMNLQLGFGDI